MWKKIDSYFMISKMQEGDIITDNPNDESSLFQIKSLHQGFVKVIRADSEIELKMFLPGELINGAWWVKG